MVCYELGAMWSLVLWCLPEQLHPRPDVLLLRTILCPGLEAIPLVEEIHHPRAADSVLFDHDPDRLCSGMALRVPQRLAVFPDWLHVPSYHTLLKLLHSDLQEA